MIFLDRIHAIFERLSLWAVWAGGTAILLAAFMVTIEVVGRKLGGTEVLGLMIPQFRIPGSDEYTGYVFAASTSWAYAFCLMHRSHIRIDALYNLLPQTLRALLDIFALVMLLVYIGFLTEKTTVVLFESWVRDSVSVTPQQTPLWIPQLFWVSGLVFFSATLVFLIIYAVATLFTRGTAGVQKLAGTLSVQEEVASETRGMKEFEK